MIYNKFNFWQTEKIADLIGSQANLNTKKSFYHTGYIVCFNENTDENFFQKLNIINNHRNKLKPLFY